MLHECFQSRVITTQVSPSTANSSNLLIAATPTMNTQSRKPSQLASLFCGVTAGAVEGGITYPTEFVKTQAQFSTTKGQPVSVQEA